MKTLISVLAAIMVINLYGTDKLIAQENQEKNKQKDIKKKQQIIDQKKQQKELDSITEKVHTTYDDELRQLIEEQKKLQSEGDEIILEEARDHSRENRKIIRSYDVSGSKYFVAPYPPYPPYSGSGDNTTFTISKNLKDTFTFSSDFEYEVPDNVVGLYFVFSSELEAGSLKLSITKPGGKIFQVFSVAPVANVDWNKQLVIKEGESKEFSGTWKITISTKEAKGFYQLKINSK